MSIVKLIKGSLVKLHHTYEWLNGRIGVVTTDHNNIAYRVFLLDDNSYRWVEKTSLLILDAKEAQKYEFKVDQG